jgi:phosphoribosylglycinamide formyltransferase-1
MKIAVFASGRGSNFAAILDAIRHGTLPAHVCCLISNRSDAGALERARAEGIPAIHCSRLQYATDDAFAEELLARLRTHSADFIALAGYLKRVPTPVVAAFRERIVNIHPALLPSFGGHGMYGHRVHEAVLAAGAKVSGATVHVVDEEYDRGPIVAQRCVSVLPDDTPDTLAARVLTVEHSLYPETLAAFARGRVRIDGQLAWIIP